VGILLIGNGLLLNEFLLTALFSEDGILELSTRIIIWTFDGFCICSGFLLVLSKACRILVGGIYTAANRILIKELSALIISTIQFVLNHLKIIHFINSKQVELFIKVILRYKIQLLILTIILGLKHSFFIFEYLLPVHDTLAAYQNFYYFYNEIINTGTIAQWNPFGSYGISSALGFMDIIAPVRFLILLIGWILGVEDVLVLFNLSIFIKELILMLGVFTLSRYLFTNRFIGFYLCLIVILSTTSVRITDFGLDMYYLFPFVILYINKFFERMNLAYLLISSIIFLVSLLGTPIYTVPVQFLPILCMFIVMGSRYLKKGRELLSFNKLYVFKCVISFICLLIIAISFYKGVNGLMYNMSNLIVERGEYGRVSLATFLTYSEIINISTLKEFIFIPHNFRDISLYFGIIPFLLIIYSIISSKALNIRLITMFLIATLLHQLFNLSFLTFLDKTSSVLLHKTSIELIIMVISAFVTMIFSNRIQQYVDDKRKSLGLSVKFPIVFYALLLSAFILLLFSMGDKTPLARILYYIIPFMDSYRHIGYVIVQFIVILPFITGYALDHLIYVLKKKKSILSLKLFVIIVFIFTLIDLFQFQYRVMSWYHNISKDAIKHLTDDFVRVNNYSYQPFRVNVPMNRRQENILRVLDNIYGGRYTVAYSHLQLDPCLSRYRIDLLSSEVAEYLFANGAIMTGTENASNIMSFKNNDLLFSSICCEASKLRVLRIYESEGLIIRIEDIQKEVKVSHFSANKLVVETKLFSADNAWLYYADSWDPGWKSFVNGEEEEVRKSEAGFKLVKLRDGLNEVEFIYSSNVLNYQLVLMVAGIFVLLSIVIKSLKDVN